MSNQRFKRLVKKYYDFLHRTYPVMATYLGIHRYDHLVGDLSERSINKEIQTFKKFKRELRIKNYELRKWKIGDRIDYQLLESDVEMNLFSLEKTKDWQRNPNLYVETLLMSVFLLTSRNSVPMRKKVGSVISRLNQFGKILRQAKENLKNPPRIYTEIALETMVGALFFVEQIKEQFARKGMRGKEKKKLGNAAESAKEALLGFQSYLRSDLLGQSKGNFALGQKYFEFRLRREHFLNLSASELYRFGLGEFRRVQREVKILARKMSRRKSWQDLIDEIKNKTPGAKNLLKVYRQEVNRLAKFIKAKDLLTFAPGEKCQVLETPDFERPTVPYAAYMPPAPFERDQTGHFWVTSMDQKLKIKDQKEALKEHCYAALTLTTLHESYPGHHLQFSRANRVKSIVRRHGGSSLLCEGWALYCEQLMGEVGYYRSDSVKLFALKDELWRAARIMIDVGLHCHRMAVKEAVDLLVKKVKLAPAQALSEVKRYTLSPTQPMSYLVGKRLILNMRRRAQSEWGKDFSLKKFHDRFLDAGTIPTPLVEQEMFSRS